MGAGSGDRATPDGRGIQKNEDSEPSEPSELDLNGLVNTSTYLRHHPVGHPNKERRKQIHEKHETRGQT